MDKNIAQLKLAAWLHDPPEKALILFRTRRGHEGGTVKTLLEEALGSAEVPDVVRTADRIAAAADRPDRPRPPGTHPSLWERIYFPKEPVLIHPLSGQQYKLPPLGELHPDVLEKFATECLSQLVRGAAQDPEGAFLRLWRLAPEVPNAPKIQSLWRLLPADTRVPDHSIWEHLSLASALAGALAHEEKLALLSVAIGPVQPFLQQGRSTHDLWAGSHLLSAFTWEAMRPVVEELGPDAIILPSLRGNPFCDAWLVQRGVVELTELQIYEPGWQRTSDAHPLCAASLPNRFLAVVPLSRAGNLAEASVRSVREAALDWAKKAWEKIRELAQFAIAHADFAASQQIPAQLQGFPEVHWAWAEWPTAIGEAQLAKIKTALATFEAEQSFFDSQAWRLLSKEISVAGASFWQPNAGVLYPAVFDLAERALAASKATRTFEQLSQRGYRCSVCGEREWLAASEEAIELPAGRRKRANEDGREDRVKRRGDRASRGTAHPSDPWPAVAKSRPAWARGTEHLCAVCMLKRLWPAVFFERIRETLESADLQRFAVSTHTMASVPVLRRLETLDDDAARRIEQAVAELEPSGSEAVRWVALPRALASGKRAALGRRLIAAQESLDDRESRGEDTRGQRHQLETVCRTVFGVRFETYYAVLLLDGDRMGAWVAGENRPKYEQLWHPGVRDAVRAQFASEEAILSYLDMRAPTSPAYHTALSRALGDLAVHLVPFVIEELCYGKLLYSGGDDVLALLPVSELVPAMALLRAVWSGELPSAEKALGWLLCSRERLGDFQLGGGHVGLGSGKFMRLFRTLGEKASCSIGAVVAHHTAPLASVLRQLRAAEQRAKRAGGNSFCIVLDKRSGDTSELVGTFSPASNDRLQSTTLGILLCLQRLFERKVSRRGAYLCAAWLADLVEHPAPADMLAALIAYQLKRALRPGEAAARVDALAKDVAAVAQQECPSDPAGWLTCLIQHAEFLARPERAARRRELRSTGRRQAVQAEEGPRP